MPPSPLDRYRQDGVNTMSPQRLLVLLYQRLLADLDRSATAMELDRPADAHDALMHAQDIVAELHLALDASVWAGAEAMGALYDHVEVLLIEANVTKSSEPVERCRQVVQPLAEAWEQAYRIVSTERSDVHGYKLA